LWAAHSFSHAGTPPFANHDDLHDVIDGITEGNAPWHSFNVAYNGPFPENNVAGWMTEQYEVWHRDPRQVVHQLLSNPEFNGHFDYTPHRQFEDNQRRWSDFMSGNWAWKQAVCNIQNPNILISLNSTFLKDLIAEDEQTHGSMFVPIVLGSDKTTVSVATGQNEFYPLYMSIGNVKNNIRRAHKNALVLIGFLAIPKGNLLLLLLLFSSDQSIV
jgi:hypothetical protein